MPLVKAESDESFIVEVADEVQTSCARMNEHVSGMIEEYLRRRAEQLRQEIQQRCDAQVEQMKQRLASEQNGRSVAEEQHASAKRQLAEAATVLHRSCARERLLGFFSDWRRVAEHRREQRRLTEESKRRCERLKAFQCYSLWRLFAAARRGARLEATALQTTERREQELQKRLEVYEERLRGEEEKNAKLSEDLKDAFVRGMCALNREAVQVLHGCDENPDNDVEAIADILSRDGPSRRLSTVPTKAEGSVQSSTQQSPICPVHQLDRSGHFYHRCFAPGYCPHSEHQPHSPTRASSDVSSTPPAPFVVRVDPQSVRGFNAAPAIPVRQSARSPQTRWKL